ncbi:phytochrome family protein [Crocosphaera chwakensis]|uniref:Multi-sensor Signal Transduction Histidine Kinase n=1 Tax=Crocosphaera chwakensis CCY0110 TaxID=391612 RepID=A3IMT4_9CHRO|nr:multi-sensor signal transduction histidine kinase [Crocosphaera chwakensis]EAZ92187.1 Multi-sensor Signal Transduction Histidine Kinase [Crocosphaera chwakensis CCY0110]
MNNSHQEFSTHKIGCIQPHGILLVLKEPELIIIQVSQNTDTHLGISCNDLLGKKLNIIVRIQV